MSSFEFLHRLLTTEFGIRPEAITPDSTPGSLGLDSLSTVELIGELEREFGIALTPEQANFETMAEAATIVDALIEANGN